MPGINNVSDSSGHVCDKTIVQQFSDRADHQESLPGPVSAANSDQEVLCVLPEITAPPRDADCTPGFVQEPSKLFPGCTCGAKRFENCYCISIDNVSLSGAIFKCQEFECNLLDPMYPI